MEEVAEEAIPGGGVEEPADLSTGEPVDAEPVLESGLGDDGGEAAATDSLAGGGAQAAAVAPPDEEKEVRNGGGGTEA